MITFKFLGTAVILSALSATPAMAQHMIEEPGVFAFFHPNGDLGIASTKTPADAMASVAGNGGLARMRMQVRSHSLRDKRAQSTGSAADR
jgi:hypothetical protein